MKSNVARAYLFASTHSHTGMWLTDTLLAHSNNWPERASIEATLSFSTKPSTFRSKILVHRPVGGNRFRKTKYSGLCDITAYVFEKQSLLRLKQIWQKFGVMSDGAQPSARSNPLEGALPWRFSHIGRTTTSCKRSITTFAELPIRLEIYCFPFRWLWLCAMRWRDTRFLRKIPWIRWFQYESLPSNRRK